MSATAALQTALTSVRAIAKTLEPDGDVLPMLLIETPWETKIIALTHSTDAQKDEVFDRFLPDFIVRHKAKAIVFVTMVWARSITYAEGDALPRNADGVVEYEGPRPSDAANW